MVATKAVRQLIDDAKKAGRYVKEDHSTCQIRFAAKSYSIGVVIYEDGSAHRADVDLACTTAIRTLKTIREILKLS